MPRLILICRDCIPLIEGAVAGAFGAYLVGVAWLGA
jgi:hypothetical protein